MGFGNSPVAQVAYSQAQRRNRPLSPHAPSHFGVHICNNINCYCITFKRLHPWEHGLKKLFNDFIRGNEQRIRSSVQRPASSGSHLYSLKLMFTPSTHACSSIVILHKQAGRGSTHHMPDESPLESRNGLVFRTILGKHLRA